MRYVGLLLAVPLLVGADLGRAQASRAEGSDVDIVAIDLAGRQTNLTHSAGSDLGPAVARDGRIVFLSMRGGSPDFYVMDGDGGNVRKLTNGAVDKSGVAGAEDLEFSQAAWSPGGDQIAFDGEYWAAAPDCEQHCVSWRVMTIHRDGSGLEQVALGARAPAWSPNGRRLAYESGIDGYFGAGSVAMSRIDGSGSVQVKADNTVSSIGPVWSPSGRQIAFQTQRWIYVVDADGRHRRRLSAGQDPAWSPDGHRLAFIENLRLMTIGANGKAIRRVSRTGEFVTGAAWSPTGKMLGYVAGTTADPYAGLPRHLRVETVTTDGKRVHILAREPAAAFVWGRPVWTPNGKRILISVER